MAILQRSVTLRRKLFQKTNNKTIKEQVVYIAKRATAGNRKVWKYRVTESLVPILSKGFWIFAYKIDFERKIDGRSTESKWAEILKIVIETGRYNKYPWIVTSPNEDEVKDTLGELYDKIEDTYVPDENRPTVRTTGNVLVKNYGSIRLDKNDYFNHIYDRDAQIEIIISALSAAEESQMQNRFNCVLHGPPGCGKTEILESVGKMLGELNKDFYNFDATSTTKAGVEKLLLDPNNINIPSVLIIEKIEKTDENSLRWLLGILDHRGRIQKLNFRVDNKARNVKLLALATVNDIALFKKVMSGALFSRFANKIYCPRPGREVMARILEREVIKVKGKIKWIEPTLEFCYDKLKWNDPREIIPICLCGRDRLFDNSYQRWKIMTLDPESIETLKETSPEYVEELKKDKVLHDLFR